MASAREVLLSVLGLRAATEIEKSVHVMAVAAPVTALNFPAGQGVGLMELIGQ